MKYAVLASERNDLVDLHEIARAETLQDARRHFDLKKREESIYIVNLATMRCKHVKLNLLDDMTGVDVDLLHSIAHDILVEAEV